MLLEMVLNIDKYLNKDILDIYLQEEINRVLKKFRKGCIYLITLKKDYAKFYRRYKKSKCDIAFPRDLL